ncbi:DUF362 domain-containing protein [Bacteroidota bacterium]
MKKYPIDFNNIKNISRRDFVKTAAVTPIAGSLTNSNILKAQQKPTEDKPKTNIQDALKYPRTKDSLPGKYPGRVVIIENSKAIKDGSFDYEQISFMIDRAMMILTSQEDRKKAWGTFFSPSDRIGIKVNPVGGTLLSTSREVVRSIIMLLVNIGVPLENIVIWDRREFQLHEAGFTSENFPGVKITGTERKDEKGSFYDKNGRLYSEDMIDKSWFYHAEVDGNYDKETLPYMVNGGKYSFFSKICTQDVDKIINVPILKNAGGSATLCLKNIAYGSVTNTGRLHKQLWAETCAEVPCFPPIRDKMVLNIVDGIRGCYNGGPGAKPEFFHDFNSILVGTDPVAVDRIGFDKISDKRIEKGIQKERNTNGMKFLKLAEDLGIGYADLKKIEFKKYVF